MAVALQIQWDGFTPKQYDELRRRLDWDNNPPDGAIFHAAWFDNDGLESSMSGNREKTSTGFWS